MKLNTKRQIGGLTLLLAVTYMVSYITRINFGAVISEMESATGITKSLLSMAVTGSFVTYGVGQIVSGILGDRFSPKRLVTCGLIVTVCMNLLIPLCRSPYQMLGVWCVNGFAQSFMWPPLVRIMTSLLSDEDYKRVTVKVSWGSSIGTIVVYLMSPLLISLWGWKTVFVFSSVCGIVMIFVWNRFCREVEDGSARAAKRTEQQAGGEAVGQAVERAGQLKSSLVCPMMAGVMLAIILQGMLRDGVTTWMPSYISEEYQLSRVVSILSGVILPIFGILCFAIVSPIYRKLVRNPLTCAGLIFGVGAVAALGLFLFTGRNAACSVVLSALLTGCMHGVNLMLICMLPPYFAKYGVVSTISGVLNSCTYIGSAVSTYGIALLSERIGWSYTLLVWFGIAAAGTALCLACARPWRVRMMNAEKPAKAKGAA